MGPLVTFWALILASARGAEWRARLRAKSRADWSLDLLGLAVQGWLIPVLQIGLVYGLLSWLAPDARGALDVPPVAAFFLNFVVVDYLYYWNHRLFHTDLLWPIHAVHHTVTSMDTFGTSRNTLWSSFFIVYLHANGLFAFLLADARPFLLGVSLTAALDLWRHSGLVPPRRVAAWLRPWLILPDDHAWHHAAEGELGNFGANLKLWDRLHGTALARSGAPEQLGIPSELGVTRKLLWPFGQVSR